MVGNMIDLTSFEFGAGGVTNGGNAGNRDVEWYEMSALTTLISAGAGVRQDKVCNRCYPNDLCKSN